MFGLEQKHIDFILKILHKNFPYEGVEFYVFGSRAKGNYKEYSDIDIAIKFADKKLSVDALGKALLEFKDSTLPYSVDLMDLNAIEKDFYYLIENSLIKL